MVNWERPKRELGIMGHVTAFDNILFEYPGPAAHDGTGMSSFVSEVLQNYSHPVPWQNKKLIAETMNKLISDVQLKKVKFPKIEWLERQFRSLTYDQAYGKDHLPDGVASLVMAWYAKSKVLRTINISGGKF